MALIVCGAEGEWALFSNTLDLVGADDKRRGSVLIDLGAQMYKNFGPVADCWVHVRFAGYGSNSVSSAISFLQIRDTNGNIVAALQSDSRSYAGLDWLAYAQYASGSGGALVTNPESFPLLPLEFQDWDIHIEITTNAATNDTMTVTFYRNGQRRFFTTVVDPAGWALPSEILLQHKASTTNNERDNVYYQDVIVSDGVPTVGMELATLVPSAVGNYNAFINDYNNIDDNGYDPSTVISTTTPTDRESWIFSSPTFNLNNKVIYAIALDTVAQLDLGGNIADFQPFLRISAIDYAAASLGANSVNPDSYVSIFTQNPATANPWQASDLSGLEAGILAQ